MGDASRSSETGRARGIPPLLQPPPLRTQVYERLRGAILGGELTAGMRLSPVGLAASLGVSAMPVREALRLLEEDGLVETSARRWTRVAAPDLSLAEEVYPLVGLLEGFAVEQGEAAGRVRLAALRRANRELRAAGADGDVVGCIDADARFHQTLIEDAGNATLVRTINELKARVRLLEGLFFRTESTRASVDQHAQIVAALAAGDREAAAAAVRDNWASTLEAARSARERERA